MSFFKNTLLTSLLALGLYACKDSSLEFKVGVTAGPHAVIMEEVKKIASKEGLTIKIIEFNDFNLPNAALAQGDLALNIFQHEPFLKEEIKKRGYDLAVVGRSVVMPLGLYSHKVKNFADINTTSVRPGAKVAIPNDPTNEGRALKLMEEAGFIKLRPSAYPTPVDIIDNPLQLKFIEIEAPQIPRILDDVELAIINTDWVLLAGEDPRAALFHEKAPQEFANVIVARRQDKDDPQIKRFLKIYQSDALKAFIKDKFAGAVEPAW